MSEKNHKSVIRGLRGVAAATTKTSFVDPLGTLFYSGYDIDDLVDRATYEEVIYLLLNNELPTNRELANLKLQLFSEMVLPEPVIERIKSASIDCHPMDICAQRFLILENSTLSGMMILLVQTKEEQFD